jgi:hypothetical protein
MCSRKVITGSNDSCWRFGAAFPVGQLCPRSIPLRSLPIPNPSFVGPYLQRPTPRLRPLLWRCSAGPRLGPRPIIGV